ncbi:MAG TPA: polymer-forming cytoskeletal protein [Terriglobales bacterium]|nr:polymer-forming cytoskeletal protein [Terriglobales bacterium]
MGTKENFNQALNEFFSFRGNAKDSGVGMPIITTNLAESLEDKPKAEPGKPLDFQSAYDTKIQQSTQTTRITEDTKITGNIVSKSHLDISGDVFGDVESLNNVKISGRIEGNVKGKNVEVSHAKIKGDIHASELLTVVEQSEITGNIYAGELDFNSRINGTINVKQGANILKDSMVIGDITAALLNIETGAVLKSMLNVTGERKANVEDDL